MKKIFQRLYFQFSTQSRMKRRWNVRMLRTQRPAWNIHERLLRSGVGNASSKQLCFDALAAGVFNPRMAERARRERNREAKSEAERNCVRDGVCSARIHNIRSWYRWHRAEPDAGSFYRGDEPQAAAAQPRKRVVLQALFSARRHEYTAARDRPLASLSLSLSFSLCTVTV